MSAEHLWPVIYVPVGVHMTAVTHVTVVISVTVVTVVTLLWQFMLRHLFQC